MLYLAYKSIRNEYRLIGELGISANRSRSRRSTDSCSLLPSISENIANYASTFDQIKCSIVITQEILDKWKSTYFYRHHLFVKHGVEQYLRTCTCLNANNGYELILLDYDAEYGSNDNLFTSWQDESRKIISASLTQQMKDKDLQKVLSEYVDFAAEELGIQVVAVLILPYLINTKITRQSEKDPNKRGNVKKQEILNSFIRHFKTEEEQVLFNFQQASVVSIQLENVEQPAKKKAKKSTSRFLPHIVIIGEINNLISITVKFNNISYKFDSLLKAIDVSFKIFLTFKLPFTDTNCPHIWTFFQKYIYKISNYRIYKDVTDFCTTLNNTLDNTP